MASMPDTQIEDGRLVNASALDDFAGVHECSKTTKPALDLPARIRIDVRTGNQLRKVRAPSPVCQDSAAVGNREAVVEETVEVPPPIPPRIPPRSCRSLRCDRPVPDHAGPSDVPTFSRSVSTQTSGLQLLRLRPPPPPRDSVQDISLSPVDKPVAWMSSSETNRISPNRYVPMDRDNTVWWPLDEQRPSPSGQVHQLTHWPIPSLSAVSSTDVPPVRSRKMNDYVDSPVILCPNAQTTLSGLQTPDISLASQTVQVQPSVARHPWPVPRVPPTSVPSNKVKPGSSKELETAAVGCQQGILCSRCGKCRCRQCTETKPLPQCWVREQECSAQAAVDCCTCICCARALFYHCRSSEECDHSDDPCSCTEGDCCKRWMVLSLLSLFIPCLCLYWPLNSALRLCTACYNRRRNQGCRCQSEQPTEASKGLLLDSESSASS